MIVQTMFKYSIIKEENKKELIETKLYINEAMDLISLLLIYVSDKVKREIDDFINEYYDKYTGYYLKTKEFLNNIKYTYI